MTIRLIALFLVLMAVSLGTSAQQKSTLKTKPLICGHRGGYYAAYPENSMALINHVMETTKDVPIMIEIDIRKSKDGTLYILHDETVDRTTNGKGKIADLNDDYVRTLLLKKSNGELSDERIITLHELLQQLKNTKCQLMLDIKTDVWTETAKIILDSGWSDKSIFLTFNPEHTKTVTAYSDKLMVSALVRNENDLKALKNIPMVTQKRIAYVQRDAPVEFIDKLRQAGYKIMADVSEYTTHEGAMYERSHYVGLAKNKKLDVLITDFPVEVIQFLFR